ncbi:MAG: hypothetical protein ACJZ18_04310 [Methylophilaceae bacterium]|tara:strand:+ start:286 stop:549 length:264 start_codon:yes stop_codon:yes gene_type:complete
MNKLLLITLMGFLMLGCSAQEEVKAFHPTDDVSAQSQGGKGFTADDASVVQLESPAPEKPFHPTDDVSSQAQGGKGETSDGSEAQLP